VHAESFRVKNIYISLQRHFFWDTGYIISFFLDMTFAHEGSETLTNDQLVNFTKMVRTMYMFV
jgi:hypothetical protein